MRASHVAAAFVVGLSLGCLRAWEPTGPYRCESDGACPDGLTCDDGLCCRPGGSPACPTLAVEGRCASGQAPRRFYTDGDGDGVGAGAPRLFCSQPRASGVVPELLDGGRVVLDCDDSDAGLAVNPFAPEQCNGVDDNCNGEVDEGLSNLRPWFRDRDGDGFGDDTDRQTACAPPPGYVARGGDCDVMAADVFPGAPESCNNRDDNCNGQPDDAPFADAESPGVPGAPAVDCMQNLGACSQGGIECRFDAGARANQRVCVPRSQPRTETCNGVDDDCDAVVDDSPGCGGPPSLTSTPRVVTGAVRTIIPMATGPRLPPGCQKGRAGADAQSWFNPTWVGSQGWSMSTIPVRHTWFAEAEGTTTWDLSRTTRLSLALTDRTGLTIVGRPIFSDAIPGPIVTLCGPTDAVYRRFTPRMNQLGEGQSLRVTLSITPTPTAGWDFEESPGFSLAEVRRVELTVVPNQQPDGGAFDVRTFTVTVLPDAGFLP